MHRHVSRRAFLEMALLSGAGSLLAACSPSPSPSAPPTAAPAAKPTSAPAGAAPTSAPAGAAPPAAPKPAAPTAAAAAAPAGGRAMNVYSWTVADFYPLTSGTALIVHHLDGNRLVGLSPDLSKLVPELAASWEFAPDGKSFTFKLRQGMQWHDGQPITARDVLFTYNLAANPAASSTYLTSFSNVVGYPQVQQKQATTLAGLQAEGDSVVKFSMANPDAVLPKKLGKITIIPEHRWKDVDIAQLRTNQAWSQPGRVMSGPYKFVRYVPDQYLEFEANKGYFLGAPQIERIFYRIYSSKDTGVAALEKGEIDAYVLQGVPVGDVERLKKNANLTLANVPSYTGNQLIFNYRANPEFKDKRVRQAIAHAIDTKTIIAQLWQGQAVPSYSPIVQKQYQPPELKEYPFDPARARQLLKDANFDTSRKYDMIYYYADDFNKTLTGVLQESLNDVGIKIQPTLLDLATANRQMIEARQFSMAYVGYSVGLDPDDLTEQSSTEGARNYTGLSDPKVDDLLRRGRSTVDETQRQQIYFDLARQFHEEQWYVTLWQQTRYRAYSKKLCNVAENFSGPLETTLFTPAAEKWAFCG